MGEETTDNQAPSSLSYLRDRSTVRGAFQDPESVRRRAALAQVESVLKKMQECVELQLTPEAKNWPTEADYNQLRSNVTDVLDPRHGRRKYNNPLWRYAFAAVDNANRSLLLKNRIQRFMLRAASIVEEIDRADVPPSVALAIACNRVSDRQGLMESVDLFRRALRIADGKVVPDGRYAAELFEQCPKDFREVFPTSSFDGVPARCHPLAEYAAAAEIARVHRAYIHHQSKWLSDLGTFLSYLGAKDFAALEKRVALLVVVIDDRFFSEWKEREGSRKRVQKHRERKKDCTGDVTSSVGSPPE